MRAGWRQIVQAFFCTSASEGVEAIIKFACAHARRFGDSLVATSYCSIPYVDWGLRDPAVLLFTVAKQVDVDTAGLLLTQEPTRGFYK